MTSAENFSSPHAKSEAASEEKANERGPTTPGAPGPNTGARSNNPKQSRVRGSGYSETDSRESVAPKVKGEPSGAPSAEQQKSPGGREPSRGETHARGQDADDQLTDGKSPPRGTNTAGGVSNEPKP